MHKKISKLPVFILVTIFVSSSLFAGTIKIGNIDKINRFLKLSGIKQNINNNAIFHINKLKSIFPLINDQAEKNIHDYLVKYETDVYVRVVEKELSGYQLDRQITFWKSDLGKKR